MLLCCIFPLQANAIAYFFAVDVPTTLGGTDYTSNQILTNSAGAYSLNTSFPAGLELSAFDVRPDGTWLFSPAFPVTLGGIDYEPRDIVSYNGTTYSYFFKVVLRGFRATR